jgi:ABC-type transport system substrate-binding protein
LPAGGWQRGASLRLVRHDAYFRPGLPHLDAVEWTFNMHPLAQRFRFESGDVDLLRDITQADQRRFAADPRWIPLGHADADTTLYGEAMNTTMAPFDNVEVRRAVACAVNREHYRLLKPSSMTVVTQVIPPDIPGYDPATPGQHYDPAEALEHMRKAGYPYDPVTGRGGWPRTIEYPIYDQGLLLLTAQLLQQDLAKIGLRIDLRLVSWEAFLTLQGRASGATLSQGNWQMDYPDPSSFFDSLFSTRSIAPEGGSNIAFYSNPRVDALLAEARRESSPEARRGLYAKADSIVCDEAPWAFTYSHHAYRVRQPYVMGQVTHPVWGLDPTTAWLDRTGRSVEQALVPGLRR